MSRGGDHSRGHVPGLRAPRRPGRGLLWTLRRRPHPDLPDVLAGERTGPSLLRPLRRRPRRCSGGGPAAVGAGAGRATPPDGDVLPTWWTRRPSRPASIPRTCAGSCAPSRPAASSSSPSTKASSPTTWATASWPTSASRPPTRRTRAAGGTGRARHRRRHARRRRPRRAWPSSPPASASTRAWSWSARWAPAAPAWPPTSSGRRRTWPPASRASPARTRWCISGSTQALVHGFVTLEPLGAPPLKGVDRPCRPSWCSARPRSSPASTSWPPRPHPARRAGRGDGILLEVLGRRPRGDGGWSSSAASRGSEGRLVRELREQVERGRAAWWSSSGLAPLPQQHPPAHHRAPAAGHGLERRAPSRRCRASRRWSAAPSSRRRRRRGARRAAGGRHRPGPPPGAPRPRGPQAATLDVLTELIVGLARERPAVLVCEDLQWVDPTTTELMSGWSTEPPPGC